MDVKGSADRGVSGAGDIETAMGLRALSYDAAGLQPIPYFEYKDSRPCRESKAGTDSRLCTRRTGSTEQVPPRQATARIKEIEWTK